ncbi:pyrroline-5-carboxylate reductase [Parasphingopyxis lamellibrachiae]|uniref:Pyrroline-5-carboxylate reductase n=1 Tax=Parasphingopyxis lamellibrachiae TaxID=680125 RepID=A0A3D9FEB4_9SPHN|nr:pyrroline-5-carboxylate reductase [Parasphingopyxis lamellibrachiae]RED16093.1 pyrroline-5-carboxylate reductase [Parasphingopyxis lamellibrachiae]
MSELPIWLIGCGNMAGAMLAGWLVADEPTDRFRIVRPSGVPFGSGISVQSHLPQSGFGEAIVQIGFKPHMLADIAPDMRSLVGPETCIVSILAGVELATLREAFPDAGQIVRAMPNTPVALGKGVVGLIAEDEQGEHAADVATLMAKLGLAEWIADERLFDVVTALSGSGPAFVFRFMDALARGGEALGLDPAQALRMAVETVRGAAELAGQSDERPATLADRVASPGGSTRKGLDILDDDEALAKLVHATLEAATSRNREMAEEARR